MAHVLNDDALRKERVPELRGDVNAIGRRQQRRGMAHRIDAGRIVAQFNMARLLGWHPGDAIVSADFGEYIKEAADQVTARDSSHGSLALGLQCRTLTQHETRAG